VAEGDGLRDEPVEVEADRGIEVVAIQVKSGRPAFEPRSA